MKYTNPYTHAAGMIDGGYSVQDALRKVSQSVKSIVDFGGSPSNSDNSAAFAAAVVWANSQDNPSCITFPAGIYRYTTSPNWAVDYLCLRSLGDVRFRYEGTGNAFILDGGTGVGVFGMDVGHFLVEAPATSLDGVYCDSVNHSRLSFNVRGCGLAGMRLKWGVVNEIRIIVSVNEGGWYLSAKPWWGLYLDERGGGDASAYNLFADPVLEGCQIGCEIENSIGNAFIGGTMEACTTYGLKVNDVTANWNKMIGTDFEQNGTADITCDGIGNEFWSTDTYDEIIFTANAKNNKVLGGSHKSITLDAGARSNIISAITIDRFGSIPPGVVTDNGTDTLIRDLVDNAGNVIVEQGLTLNLVSLPAEEVISVTASPFTYTNSATKTRLVGVLTDQSITDIQFVRGGVGQVISTTHGMWEVPPGDQLIVTYPGTAPSMRTWPLAR